MSYFVQLAGADGLARVFPDRQTAMRYYAREGYLVGTVHCAPCDFIEDRIVDPRRPGAAFLRCTRCHGSRTVFVPEDPLAGESDGRAVEKAPPPPAVAPGAVAKPLEFAESNRPLWPGEGVYWFPPKASKKTT